MDSEHQTSTGWEQMNWDNVNHDDDISRTVITYLCNLCCHKYTGMSRQCRYTHHHVDR